MKKLLDGVALFQKTMRDDYKTKYGSLASQQDPKILFITCCDSRVVPQVFTCSEPGDLFVVRNIGNLVPEQKFGQSWLKTFMYDIKIFHQARWDAESLEFDTSVRAAIEYALHVLHVSDIVVCGHSNCGAMKTLLEKSEKTRIKHKGIRAWLKHAKSTLNREKENPLTFETDCPVTQLSQTNVVQQLDNLKTYPEIQKRLANHEINIHGWYFDLESALVHRYDDHENKFVWVNKP